MLEPGDILVDCTGARSLLRDHLLPGDDLGERDRNTDALPARVRPGRHLPVRPALRVQRVLQVLQEPRERRATSSSRPSTAPTTTASVSHVTGIVEHQPGRVRGDAVDVRRRVAARALPRRRGVHGPVHRQGQGRDPRRARRRPRRSPASRSTSIAPGTRRAGAGAVGRDHPLATAPVFLLGDSAIGSPYFQSISLGLECAFFLAGHIGNRAMSDRRRSSSATRRSCTSSGCGSTCAPR